jgi:hypothetical protein
MSRSNNNPESLLIDGQKVAPAAAIAAPKDGAAVSDR